MATQLVVVPVLTPDSYNYTDRKPLSRNVGQGFLLGKKRAQNRTIWSVLLFFF